MLQFFRKTRYQYSPVNGGSRIRTHYSRHIFLVTAAFVLASAITGFYAGRLSIHNRPYPPIDLSIRKTIFHHSRTFGAAPSNVSDAAWESIFPEQGGFFKHPALAPQRSAWAVFHQLHCLNGIRQGYWALYSAATVGEKVIVEEIPMMYSPAHIVHCIDLIRQSLMCQPDLTIEVKDPEIGGVTGFGTQHQCKVWEELIEWTSKWQSWEQEPRTQSHDKHSDKGMHKMKEHIPHQHND